MATQLYNKRNRFHDHLNHYTIVTYQRCEAIHVERSQKGLPVSHLQFFQNRGVGSEIQTEITQEVIEVRDPFDLRDVPDDEKPK